MGIVALATWITAAAGGLYLVSIWLIEYDKEFQTTAATRLRPTVLISHITLAGGGLIVWAGYLLFKSHNLVWISALALLLAATLGITMAIRWIGVYRETRAVKVAAGVDARPIAGPPERNFPLPVVIGHGLFAVATLTIVLLIAFGASS